MIFYFILTALLDNNTYCDYIVTVKINMLTEDVFTFTNRSSMMEGPSEATMQ